MEWPKLKNIILIILLITNGFLLALVGFRSWNAAQCEAQAREDALQVLLQNGIRMDAASLPRDQTLSVCTVTREQEKEAALLAPLLGEVSAADLGGGQYLYTGEKGAAKLRARGEFEIQLTAGAFPQEGELTEHAAALLSRMGFESLAVETEGDGVSGSVSFFQLWEGAPVPACKVTVAYAKGCAVSISGSRLSGTPLSAGKSELSAVTGLLRLLEQSDTPGWCREIRSMRAAYQLTASLSGPSVLSPVWYFELDGGRLGTLDLLTGQWKEL